MRGTIYMVKRAGRWIRDPALEGKGLQYLSFSTLAAAKEWRKTRGAKNYTIVLVRIKPLEVIEWE